MGRAFCGYADHHAEQAIAGRTRRREDPFGVIRHARHSVHRSQGVGGMSIRDWGMQLRTHSITTLSCMESFIMNFLQVTGS